MENKQTSFIQEDKISYYKKLEERGYGFKVDGIIYLKFDDAWAALQKLNGQSRSNNGFEVIKL